MNLHNMIGICTKSLKCAFHKFFFLMFSVDQNKAISLKIQRFFEQIYNSDKVSKFYSNHFHKKTDICDFKITTTIS